MLVANNVVVKLKGLGVVHMGLHGFKPFSIIISIYETKITIHQARFSLTISERIS
jgi:hypothetical protein